MDNLLQFSKYFDEDELATQEEEAGEAEIPAIALSQDKIDSLQQMFAVFFEGIDISPVDNDKQSPFACIRGTMPWLTTYIQQTFVEEAVLRQSALIVDLCLRGVGQVYFQDNPLSGLFILIGLFIESPRVAIHGVIGLLVGNITAILFGFTRGLLGSGLFGYNAILVGLALATFAGEWSFAVFLAVVGASAISSVVFVVMGKLLVPYQSPPFTLPFKVATLFLLVSSATSNHWSVAVNVPAFPDYTDATSTNLAAGDFFAGTIRGIGQVFLADAALAGGFVLIGIALCSPISAVAAYVGSVLGCLFAWWTGNTDGSISAGLWGYNASLCAVMMLMFFTCPALDRLCWRYFRSPQ